MNTSLALTIIGSVMGLFGIVFNINPIAVNKVIMGNLGEEAVNPAAALQPFIAGICRLNRRARNWSLWV